MKIFYLLVFFCLSFSISNAQVNLSQGLLAYYPFTGNANDVSGNNNNPSFNNATLTNDRYGNTNRAYHFNGTDTYMRIPNAPTLNLGNSMSICVMVKPTGFYTGSCHNNMLICKEITDYQPGNYSLRFADFVSGCSPTAVTTDEEFGSEPDGGVPTITPIQLNQWYTVVYTSDGTTAKLYVNCQLASTSPATVSAYSNIYDLLLGHLDNPTFPYWLNGDLDEVRLYNRAINQDEVNAYGSCISTCTQTFSTIDTTICLGQSFNGHTATGTYVDTLLNVQGCDSLRTVHLTANDCAALCDTSLWRARASSNTSSSLGSNCTTGWLKASQFVSNGVAHFPTSLSCNPTYYYSEFQMTDTMCITNNFTYETRLRNPQAGGGVDAFDVKLSLTGSGISSGCQLIGGNGSQGPVWAQQFTYAYAGANMVTNNPALVMNFDNWHIITLTYKNNILHYSLDGTEFFQLPYTGNICNIQSLGMLFKGSGDIDWTRILDADGNEVWREDFDSCAALKPFPPCPTTAPSINSSYTSPTCTNDSLYLFATANQLISYSWTGPNGFTSTNQNPTITAPTTTANGVYTVTGLTNNCSVTSTTKSITVAMPALPKSFSTKDTTICQGMSFRGHSSTGTYIDTIPNSIGCDSIMTLNLTVNSCTPPSCTLTNNLVINSGYNPVTKTQITPGQNDPNWIVTALSTDMQNSLCYIAPNNNSTTFVAPPFNGTTMPASINQPASVITRYQGWQVEPGSYLSCFAGNTIYTPAPGTPTQNATNCAMTIRRNFTVYGAVNQQVTFNNLVISCDNYLSSVIIDAGTPNAQILFNTGAYTIPAITIPNTTINLSPGTHTIDILCSNAENPDIVGSGGVYYTVTANGITSRREWNPFGIAVTGTITSTSSILVSDSCCISSTSTIDTTLCEGNSFRSHTITGTYTDIIPNAAGCDSIMTLNLTIKPKSFLTLTTTICEGQNYLGYTTSGIHIDTLAAANGCDSIRTINLTVTPYSRSVFNSSICEGQNYMGHTVADVYIDTLFAASVTGCDSIRTINLTVNKKTYDTITVTICQGQSYLGYTTTGSYNDTLVNAVGCDSITTLNLTINNNCTAAPTCNGSLGTPVVNITFGSGNNPGAALPPGTTSYSYIPVTGTPPGLIPDGSYSLVNEVPLLPGWFSGAKDHTGNPNGYMAFFNASPTTGVFYQQSITGLCAGTKYQFSTWIANVVNAAAISGGSMQPNITLELINSSNNAILGLINTGDIPNATSMTWQQFGMLFTMPSGVSSLTLVLKNNNIGGNSVQGNDFAIDDITFSPCGPQTLASFAASKITDTICANTPVDLFGIVSSGLIAPAYQWQISNGTTGIFTNIPGATSLNYTFTPGLASGNYSFALLSAEAANIGIASCRYFSNIINLNVKPTLATTITTSVCQGQNYAGHTTSGTFIDNLTAINGCDSIRTLNLTVNAKSYDTSTITLCEGQSFRGHTITGTYTDTIPNIAGCDSIMTLYLTIKPKSFSTFTQIICEGHNYLGYTTTGTYIDTLIAVNGCDSVRTINLTVTPSSRSSITTSICNGQNYLGYSTSGTYIDTLTGASITGCDSIRTLNLTVIPPSLSNITTTICEGQSYLGYTNSGTFIDTLFAASVTGCDSIRTLSLIVNAKSYDTLTASICQGQSYLGYTTTGSFNDTLTNVIGCDSIRTLQLTVNAIPIVKTNKDTSICIGTSLYINTIGATTYAWSPLTSLNFPDNTSDPVTNTTSPIQYIVTGTTNGCSASDTLNIGINQIPALSKSDNVTICKDSSTTIYANGGLNFQWSPNNTLSFPHNVNAPVAAPLVTTVYHVLVTDANNCVNTDSIKVTVRPDALFTISPSTGACANISTQLLAGGGDTYLWSPATSVSNATIKNPTTAITATTTYTVQIKEKTCGTSADLSTTLTLLPALNLIVSKSNDLDCYTPSATLYAVGADKYVWSPAIGLSNINVAEPIAKPFSTQQYFVTGTDKNGCVGQDSIIVFGNYADRMIYDMANAFTPNNDGKNDCFGVKYFGVISDFTFMIYNRWGQQMFYTTDPTACWDGTFQGQKVNQDTYVYYLKAVTACGTAEKKGTVVLLR